MKTQPDIWNGSNRMKSPLAAFPRERRFSRRDTSKLNKFFVIGIPMGNDHRADKDEEGWIDTSDGR